MPYAYLSIQVLVLAIQNEVVSFSPEEDGNFHSQQPKREAVTVLDTLA